MVKTMFIIAHKNVQAIMNMLEYDSKILLFYLKFHTVQKLN